ALSEEGAQVHLCVSGAMTVSVKVEGSQLDFASTDPRGWIEEALRGKLVALSVGARAGKADQSLTDLERGVVLGSGVDVLARAPQAPGVTAKPAPAEPATAAPAPTAPAAPAPAPAPEPAPDEQDP